MKLGVKLTALIVAVFVINAVVTVLATTPDANPAASVWIITGTHLVTLVIAGAFIYFTVTKPLAELRDKVQNYRIGTKIKKTGKKDDIGQIYDSFSRLSSQLESEKEAQNRIIASISHDIKTPLTSVMGYTEFLKNPALPEARREKYINIIYEKAQDIQNIITDFDDYLSQNIDLNLKCEFVSVSALCEAAANSIRTEFPNSRLTVVCDCGCKEETVYADSARIHRVFMNAAANSVRHAGREELQIKITAEKTGGEIVFRITDNGQGVEKDQLEKIFEPLYTTDKSRSVSGLGLAICRQIVTFHNGRIWAESEAGEFFSVCFALPGVSGKKTRD